MHNEGSHEIWEGVETVFKGLTKMFKSWRSGSPREIIVKSTKCPECNVELEPDPEEKFDFRCPKCDKTYNYSDIADN